MKIKSILFSFVFLLTFSVNAQLSQSQIQQIDSLFLDWNSSNHPGGSIGVMQNGKLVFSKAYGLASIEYEVANTTETLFNIASVSKQFTAMGIVLLHLEGKLSIDDNIRKHLPEMPEFTEKITIRHMLHHTSGMRSLHGLLGLAGWRYDDMRSNDDLMRFMVLQQELNFEPGSEYLYCNTGYMFMATIIERITNEKFADWMKKRIFEPLGMNNTYVEDNYRNVVSNNATSYYINSDGSYNRAIDFWNYVGSGNMHSTTQDMLLWLENFSNPTSGWEDAFKLMETQDKFNNGGNNNYAFGVILDRFKDLKRIQHGGSIGAYRSFIASFPERKLSIAILCNFSTSTSGKSNQITDIVLDIEESESSANASTLTPPLLKTIQLSTQELEKFTHSFWNPLSYYVRKIYVEDDTLRYFRTEDAISPLVPIAKNEFQMLGVEANLKVKFEQNKEGEKQMLVTTNDNPPIIMEAMNDPINDTLKIMQDYSGKYYSSELQTTYFIYMEDESLKFHHPRHGDHALSILKNDVLQGNYPLNTLLMIRNEKDEITGFRVSNGRVRNLWFEKQ